MKNGRMIIMIAVPFLITAGGMFAMVGLRQHVCVAGFVNAVPFAVLFLLYRHKVKKQKLVLNVSLYCAYLPAVFFTLTATLQMVTEYWQNDEVAALTPVGFLFMPLPTAVVMVVGYLIGAFFERKLLARLGVVSEPEKVKQVLVTAASKSKFLYIGMFILIMLLMMPIYNFWSVVPRVDSIFNAARWATPQQLMVFITNEDVNSVDENGQSPLHLAALRGREEIVRLLLEHGADKQLRNKDGLTALEVAVENKHKKIEDLIKSSNQKKHQSR